ncbi:Polyketide cyclase / dehydrase and lipid transport [Jannaschia faecimaris]|uniref:Polyketide cyclase / dehydrase and lipid transport n=1 Tax=Jannaschia faecimaris TaxID=1244108 RepID=A0A1H3R0M9_9RHOB|nr:SRPBCC family protein [Jannaschia faecimaris]SDZ19160.1 Polyketide cyclase / dehydrase and lipid transport [Jannaschia faecimaris]
MKFVATEDVAAPIDAVWARVCDLEAFERRAAQRVGGIRRNPSGPPGQGTEWTGTAEIMGKTRAITVTAATLAAPTQLVAEAVTDGMNITIQVELVGLGPRLTRLTVTSEGKARSLTARLMLQSAKLARKTMAKRYKARIADFASRVEKTAG